MSAGITWTAVIVSPSNVLHRSHIFSIAAKVDNTRDMFTGNRQAVVEKQCPDVSIEIIKREISGMPGNIYSTAKVPFSKILVLLKLSLCYLIKSNRRMPESVTLKTNSLGNSVSGATFAQH